MLNLAIIPLKVTIFLQHFGLTTKKLTSWDVSLSLYFSSKSFRVKKLKTMTIAVTATLAGMTGQCMASTATYMSRAVRAKPSKLKIRKSKNS